MDQKNEIIEAVKTGDLAAIKKLLKKTSQLIHAETEAGESIILLAVYYGKKEVAEYLLSKAAQLTLFEAVAVGREEETRKAVLENPESVNAYSSDGWTPLHLAAFFGHINIVEFLIEQGAAIDLASKNENKVAPLHSALANREIAIAEMLLEAGADVNVAQASGWAPLHYAAAVGNETIVQSLLSKGAEVARSNQNGQTPLDIAHEKKHENIADALLEAHKRTSIRQGE